MATLSLKFQATIALLLEAARQFGNANVPSEFAVTGQVYDTGSVGVSDGYGVKSLWSADGGGLASFQYLLFTSTHAVKLELVNATPNPDERMLFEVPAGGIVLIPSAVMGGYASNTSRLDGAALVDGTDFNNITEIRVQRDDADLTGDATVRLMLVL